MGSKRPDAELAVILKVYAGDFWVTASAKHTDRGWCCRIKNVCGHNPKKHERPADVYTDDPFTVLRDLVQEQMSKGPIK